MASVKNDVFDPQGRVLFGRFLNAQCVEGQGLTQKEFAERVTQLSGVFVSADTIGRLVRGHYTNPNFQALLALVEARVLQINGKFLTLQDIADVLTGSLNPETGDRKSQTNWERLKSLVDAEQERRQKFGKDFAKALKLDPAVLERVMTGEPVALDRANSLKLVLGLSNGVADEDGRYGNWRLFARLLGARLDAMPSESGTKNGANNSSPNHSNPSRCRISEPTASYSLESLHNETGHQS